MTRVPMVVGALVVLALLAGCSGPTAVTSSTDRTIAIAAQHEDAAEQALAQGTVRWGDAGCMVLGDVEPNLVVFPHGTTLDGETVVLPDGTKIESGDNVALGGGMHSSKDGAGQLPDIPAECLTEEIFWASGELGE
ncbi:hypothetical protein EYE40_08155 [Glaciihabitans arcticus]|uniref:Uncharacterized protein n=1 Tax=Glaciihabitans arcticus TaxID=2668039 RepID=A0A4Q9GR42_9MICO|nr:hypothetical protein [Glaciihabitans arcticus]TBN57372.1 hypothetical protein EYE40_08155 [Glaciihabitans arcticus]